MKILQIPDGEFPEPSRTMSPPPAAVPAPVPMPDMGRVDALEDITKSILGKLHAIEERIQELEERLPAGQTVPTPESKEPAPRPASNPVEINTDAMNKDLFDKMWKYLNNKAA